CVRGMNTVMKDVW
nr:immunoglobulin heavy chain junction region [Macaca mulatta]MOV51914.1 immunoglobulin heavy chain junction region [Macaca mulatta]MOV52890.1 immunoglobulin heavy chain junction region [Macaca mulatta]